jgi:hypothetical protein
MKREQLTEKILDIKRDNGWTWRRSTAMFARTHHVAGVASVDG